MSLVSILLMRDGRWRQESSKFGGHCPGILTSKQQTLSRMKWKLRTNTPPSCPLTSTLACIRPYTHMNMHKHTCFSVPYRNKANGRKHMCNNRIESWGPSHCSVPQAGWFLSNSNMVPEARKLLEACWFLVYKGSLNMLVTSTKRARAVVRSQINSVARGKAM